MSIPTSSRHGLVDSKQLGVILLVRLRSQVSFILTSLRYIGVCLLTILTNDPLTSIRRDEI